MRFKVRQAVVSFVRGILPQSFDDLGFDFGRRGAQGGQRRKVSRKIGRNANGFMAIGTNGSERPRERHDGNGAIATIAMNVDRADRANRYNLGW